MRITGGILRGRRFEAPGGSVRPTQDRVREALFSSLAARVSGARVLDLFAGSGGLGLEAWSRGASHVCWVEKDRRVASVLRRNVASLCRGPGGGAECVGSDAFVFLRKQQGKAPFDLIVADPPYEPGARERALEKTLRALEGSPMLAAGGMLAFEQSAREQAAARPGWELTKDRVYGDTRVLMYVRHSARAQE